MLVLLLLLIPSFIYSTNFNHLYDPHSTVDSTSFVSKNLEVDRVFLQPSLVHFLKDPLSEEEEMLSLGKVTAALATQLSEKKHCSHCLKKSTSLIFTSDEKGAWGKILSKERVEAFLDVVRERSKEDKETIRQFLISQDHHKLEYEVIRFAPWWKRAYTDSMKRTCLAEDSKDLQRLARFNALIILVQGLKWGDAPRNFRDAMDQIASPLVPMTFE